jgi:hypothetical protein
MSKGTAGVQKAKGGSGLGLRLALAFLGLATLTVVPLVLVLIPGMMPTLVTLFVDRQRPRYLTCTVGMMNFAGVLPILLTVAKGQLTTTAAGLALANPVTWMVMYGAAAVGWLIWGATPPLARLCLELQASQRRRALEALGKAIRQEWGDEVAGPVQSQPVATQVERDNRP